VRWGLDYLTGIRGVRVAPALPGESGANRFEMIPGVTAKIGSPARRKGAAGRKVMNADRIRDWFFDIEKRLSALRPRSRLTKLDDPVADYGVDNLATALTTH
jgi:hypothetical protein